MEAGFVARSLSHSPLVVSVKAGTLPLKVFAMSYVHLILFNRLIHLMRGQLAVSGYFRRLHIGGTAAPLVLAGLSNLYPDY